MIFLSASCSCVRYPGNVSSPRRQQPFHSNSCIQFVVPPALGELTAALYRPLTPTLLDPSTDGTAASPQRSFSVHGDPPPNLCILMTNFSPFSLHALGWKLPSAALFWVKWVTTLHLVINSFHYCIIFP